MADLIERLTSTVSSDEEVFVIQKLHSVLSTSNSRQSDTALSPTGIEKDGCINLFGEGNPYPSSTPDSICPSQSQLDQFTCYLFDRRFGWSETDTEDGRRIRKLSCSGATMSAGSSKQKAVLNTMLDSLIKWYMHQELSQSLLLALKYTIKRTANMPVVRNRAVIHTMDWCKHNAEQLCDDTFFPEIQELIMISSMDIWSAIRNACTGRLGPVAANLSLSNVEKLFNGYVKVCEEDSSWQMKEGAIMGMNAILQRFLNNSSSKSPMSSPRTLDTDIQERRIPDFITEKIHSVVFDLLSHSQLTIREHAAKTLATYITCSRIMDALDTLSEVIQILKSREQPDTSRTQAYNGQFLDDFASEGFLGVCIFLVKVIPLNYLLPGWPEYISTFLHYLSHPASTVRQAASNVFKYLVVKSSHSVVILKLLLQALAMGWNPDTDSMTLDVSPEENLPNSKTPSVCQYTGSNLSETWEGREGRLFAYELIFRYLIKNHWLYTFGPAGSGLQLEPGSSKDLSEQTQEKTHESQNTVQTEESSSEGRGLHVVESEKCLAVRFLTQTEMRVDNYSSKTQRFDRIVSMDQDGKPDSSVCQPLRTSGSGHGSGTGLSQYDNTYSLLTQAKLLDHVNNDCSENEKFNIKQDLQMKKLKQLIENNNNNKSSCVPCKCGWIEKELLQDMSRILKVILYQTAESLGHSQWELRRIANQVLPCLAEVIRWYDINLLVTLWNSYLNVAVPTCLMTFTSVMLLKESVIHAVKLVPLLLKPPHSWQDHETCRDYISSITTTIQSRLSSYLPHLQYLIQRPSFDRLSVIATDVILIAYSHFAITVDQRSSHYNTVLEFWKLVFQSAHPQSRISIELLHRPQTDTFMSPFEGYLSCCLVKPDNKIQCAKQVEKLFVSEIHHRLPTFLDNLDTVNLVSVSPILAHYIGLFVDDSHICKTLLECLQNNCGRMVQLISDCTEMDNKSQYMKCVVITLRELSAVMAMKSLDLPQIQKVLVVYEELCEPVSLNQHLSVTLSAISARLNETVEFTVDQPLKSDDLYLMSNDIPISYSDPELQDDSDSEEVIVGSPGARFPESLMLNTSNNSGSLTGRLSSLSSHSGTLDASHSGSTPREESDDEDGSSDWDSWDEEEEGQSAFGDVFSEFLQKLQKSNSTEFMLEIKSLGNKEKNVITGLIKV